LDRRKEPEVQLPFLILLRRYGHQSSIGLANVKVNVRDLLAIDSVLCIGKPRGTDIEESLTLGLLSQKLEFRSSRGRICGRRASLQTRHHLILLSHMAETSSTSTSRDEFCSEGKERQNRGETHFEDQTELGIAIDANTQDE
jgi:hypothetical protein